MSAMTNLMSTIAGRIAVGAVALAAVTGGAAAMAAGGDEDPVVVKNVSETTDTSAAGGDDATTTTAGTADSTTTTLAETETESETETDGDPAELTEVASGEGAGDEANAQVAEDNHGALVSAAAKDHSNDEACGTHGQAVSAVARGVECTVPPGQERKAADGEETADATATEDGSAEDESVEGEAADADPSHGKAKKEKGSKANR